MKTPATGYRGGVFQIGSVIREEKSRPRPTYNAQAPRMVPQSSFGTVFATSRQLLIGVLPWLAEQVRQLGDVDGNASRLVLGQPLVHCATVRVIIEVDVAESLPKDPSRSLAPRSLPTLAK